MKAALIIVVALLVTSVAGVVMLELFLSSGLDSSKEPLVVLAVWEIKPALQEIAERFERQTGRRIDLRFGASKEMLALLRYNGAGDVFLCLSAVERKRAVDEGLVAKWPGDAIVYLVPAVITRFDCPVEVTGLEGLVADELSLVIADPEQEAMGRFAADMIERAGLGEEARDLVMLTPTDAPKVVEMVSLGRADAAIAWGTMQQWDPEFLRVVTLEQSATGAAAVRAAVTKSARDTAAAEEFIAFLRAPEAQEVFRKWQCAVTLDEAAKAAPRVRKEQLGREPAVPERWCRQTEDTGPGETP